VFEASLEEHNAMSTAPMDLVMFSYAMEHTARVARVLCQVRSDISLSLSKLLKLFAYERWRW
jgi:hypothetical protein